MDSIIHNLIILQGLFNGDKLRVDSGVGFDLLLARIKKINLTPSLVLLLLLLSHHM